MKKIIVNILSTTCLVQILLIGFTIIFRNITIDNLSEVYISADVFFIIFVICIVINLGLILTGKFESKHVILEYLLDIIFISIVLFISGILIDMFYPGDQWILLIIGIIVYIIGLLTGMARINKDAKEMNELIRKRKKEKLNMR